MAGELATLGERLGEDPLDLRSWQIWCDRLLERLGGVGPLQGELPAELEREVQAVCAAQQRQWARVWGLLGPVELSWRSGFLEALRVSVPPTRLERLAALLAHPVARYLQTLRLRGTASYQLEPVLAVLPPGQLRTLGIEGTPREPLGSGSLQRLARCEALRGLTALEMTRHNIKGDAAALLAVSAPLRGLRSLDLSDNFLGDEGAIGLAMPFALPDLEVLGLSSDNICDDGATALAARPGLRVLRLGRNPIGQRGLLALADAPTLSSLEELDLTGGWLDERSVQALERSRTLRPGALRR